MRRAAHQLPHRAEDRPGIPLDAQVRGDDSAQRMRFEVEPRHDAEVAAAAAQGPHQLGMRGVVHLDDVTARGDDLRPDELIARQPPGPHHEADAAAERETAHADRRRVPRAHTESMTGEDARHVSPAGAAAHADPRAFDRDVIERGEVDGRAAGHGAPRAVATAADQDVEPLRDREHHGRADVLQGRWTEDEGGIADTRVEPARGIPARAARPDQGAAEIGGGREGHGGTVPTTSDIRNRAGSPIRHIARSIETS